MFPFLLIQIRYHIGDSCILYWRRFLNLTPRSTDSRTICNCAKRQRIIWEDQPIRSAHVFVDCQTVEKEQELEGWRDQVRALSFEKKKKIPVAWLSGFVPGLDVYGYVLYVITTGRA